MSYHAEAIPEIMRRTRENLVFIQTERERRRQRGEVDVDVTGPFEVTQLINSFMGAFAHPFEALFKHHNPSAIIRGELDVLADILLKDAWYLETAPSLEVCLGYVRNAFAHGNFEFIGDMVEKPSGGSRQDIVAIRIWNCLRENRRTDTWWNYAKTWEKQLDLDELERLLLAFVDAMGALDPVLFERDGDCPPQRGRNTTSPRPTD